MQRLLLALPIVASLAACEAPNDAALAGAALGAVTGAAVSGDDDKALGALVGAAAGAAAGNYIGRTRTGSCVYERPDGSRYTAPCP